MRAWNVNDFRVVLAGQPAISKAMLRIGKQKMSFSLLAAAEMGYPQRVQMLISEDATKLVVRPYDQNDQTAIPFYCERYSAKHKRMELPRSVSICDKPLIKDMRSRLGWGPELMVCSPLRFKEAEDTLFFDLTQAMTTERAKELRKEERSISTYPTLTSIMDTVEPVILCLAPARSARV